MSDTTTTRRALRARQRAAETRSREAPGNPWERSGPGSTALASATAATRATSGSPTADVARAFVALPPMPPVPPMPQVAPTLAESNIPGPATAPAPVLAPAPAPAPAHAPAPAGAPSEPVPAPEAIAPEAIAPEATALVTSTVAAPEPAPTPIDDPSPSPREVVQDVEPTSPHTPAATHDVRSMRATLLGLAFDIAGFRSRGGRRRWVRTVQGLVAAAAVVTLVVGLRAMFAPVSASSVPYSATFPEALATATAERFAEAYFTWDADHPETRATALAGVLQKGLSTTAGWNGEGRSTAGTADAVGLTLVDAANALVTVVVPVTPSAGTNGRTAAGTARPMALSVPVAVSGDRTWVSGLPVSVGVPKPSESTGPAKGKTDQATTTASSTAVRAYFAAIENGDVVTATSTGRSATGLARTLDFRAVQSWRVLEGDDSFRTGYADVRWATDDGALLDQSYRVVVSEDAPGDWGVRQVSAALPAGAEA